MTITAAADGSALGNPGPAGWGWYVDDDHWACGGWPHGTNNIGELTAVLDLLQQSATLDDDLVILCDSTYVINSITKWMPGWKRKNWRKGDGKPVQNVELMKALDEEMTGRTVRFQWVKGHAGHELNEQADRLANGAAMAYREGRTPTSGPGFGAGGDRADVHAEFRPTPRPEPEADLFSVSFPVSEPSDEDQVAALDAELAEGRLQGDAAAVAALLHPDWQGVDGSGRLLDRDDALDVSRLAASVAAPPPGSSSTTGKPVSVARIADDQVLVISRDFDSTGTAVRSGWWIRSHGGWRQRFEQLSYER